MRRATGSRLAGGLLKFRYELRSLLAEGAAWTTWYGFDRLRERPVLVKVLQPALAADEKAARRWMQRLQARRGQEGLASPAIVEAGRDGERFFVARKWVEGPTLEQWMARRRSPRQTLTCLEACLRVVVERQAAGQVHGRLHPGNIVLADRGPIVCDEGLAELSAETLGVEPTPRPRQVYLAPEVRRGENARPASDVYSIGVALWELLTGQRLVLDQPRPAPTAVEPNLPAGVDMVVEGMLRPDPDDRYPAAQAAEALVKLRERTQEQVARTPREKRRQRTRENSALARKPLPWPVVVILVFYRLLFILLFTGVVTVGTLGGMGYLYYQYLIDSRPPEVLVPDVTGKPQDEARRLFESELGLGFSVILKQASPTVPAGHVISTRPAAGRTVREGRTIEVIVSTGAELVEVPQLIDRPLGEALTQLERLGLAKGVVGQKPSDRVPAGSVISQSPGPGRRVAAGTKIDLYVSEGAADGQPDIPLTEPAAEEAGEAEKPRKIGRVKITVPSTPRLTMVKIVVKDDAGERTVFNELRNAGDVIVKNVEGRGETVVEVYLNGDRVQTKVL